MTPRPPSRLRQRLCRLFTAASLLLASDAIAGGGPANSQVFSSSGIFTVPAGVTSVRVQAWGMGGRGETAEYNGQSGGGGGGGAYAEGVVQVQPGWDYDVSFFNNFNNVTGRVGFFLHTQDMEYVYAKNGGNGSNGSGGLAGDAGSSQGTIKRSGGYGANGYSGPGGGGGSAYESANGGNANGATGGTGQGNGGSGGSADQPGMPGSRPGGGGAGAAKTSASSGPISGGAGGAGMVIISWEASSDEPDIAVFKTNPTTTDLTELTAYMGTQDFGSVNVSASSSAQTFIIRNDGTADLTSIAVTKVLAGNPGDFTVTTTGMSTTLAPNATTSFTVTFSPSAEGSRTAVLHISSNDDDENPFEIQLSGTGTAAPQEQIFNANGTFTVPAGVTSIRVQAWGRGGSGAARQGMSPPPPTSGPPLYFGGGGGGGGAYAESTLSVTPGEVYDVYFNPSGGQSGFGIAAKEQDLVLAAGGASGTLSGGAGGSAANSVGQIKYSGGQGANYTGPANATAANGGGGGGSATPSGNGTDASGSTGGAGQGAGGNGGGDGQAGTAGTAPGGGGGGGGSVSFGLIPGGTGGAGQVVVSWGAAPAAAEITVFKDNLSGAPLTTNSGTQSLGSVNVSASSAAQTFIIRNEGTADLTGIAVTKVLSGNPGDFTVNTSFLSTVLQPNATTTFTVTFSPSAAGSRTAVLHIASNDDDENPFVIRLQGTGTSTSTDTRAPTLTVSFPAARASLVTQVAPIVITGKAGDANGLDRVEIDYGGNTFTATLGTFTRPTTVPWSYALTPTADGPVNLTIRAYDQAGNVTTVTRNFSFIRRYPVSITRQVPAGVSQPETAGRVRLSSRAGDFSALTPVKGALTQTSAVAPGAIVKLTPTPSTGYTFSHWAGLPSGASVVASEATFTMPAEDVSGITAVFVENVFLSLGARPEFYGLIRPSAPGSLGSNATRGSYTTLLTSSGSFSGKVNLNGQTTSFRGVILGNGNVWFTAPDKSLQSGLGLPDSAQMTAMLSSGVLNVEISTTSGTLEGSAHPAAYSKTAPVPAALLNSTTQGIYTGALPAKAQAVVKPLNEYPQGSGYSRITLLTDGKLTFAGELADGTSYTASSALVAGNVSPVHAMLATPGTTTKQLGGSLLGTLAFDTSAADSDVTATDLIWFRPEVTEQSGTTAGALATQIYTAGWPAGITVDLLGALYDKTATAEATLGVIAGIPSQLTFSEGKLTAPVEVRDFTLTGNKVTKIPTTNRSFTLSFVASTGIMRGTFTPSWTSAKLPAFTGIMLSKGANRGAWGYFLSNETGDTDPESGDVTFEASILSGDETF